MAIKTIPVFSDSTNYRYSIAIDGESFIFEFRWQERNQSWYLDIYTGELIALRTGIRIVEDWPLNVRDLNPEMFAGILIAIRRDGGTGSPTLQDFQRDDCALLLISGDDIPQADETESPIVKVTFP